jgi:hypothetical protein
MLTLWKLWMDIATMNWQASMVISQRMPLLWQMAFQPPASWSYRDMAECQQMVWEKAQATAMASMSIGQELWKQTLSPSANPLMAMARLGTKAHRPYQKAVKGNLARLTKK